MLNFGVLLGGAFLSLDGGLGTVREGGGHLKTLPSGHYYLTDRPTDSRESTGNPAVHSLESIGGINPPWNQ